MPHDLDPHTAAIARLEAENVRLTAALRAVRTTETPYDCHVLADRALGLSTPPPWALVPLEDMRAAELCNRAADRLRREAPAEGASIVERAVVETLAATALEADRQSRPTR